LGKNNLLQNDVILNRKSYIRSDWIYMIHTAVKYIGLQFNAPRIHPN